ncbi:hypothetical protein ACHAXS_010025 [Conticribra weissflogii]
MLSVASMCMNLRSKTATKSSASSSKKSSVHFKPAASGTLQPSSKSREHFGFPTIVVGFLLLLSGEV